MWLSFFKRRIEKTLICKKITLHNRTSKLFSNRESKKSQVQSAEWSPIT